MTYLGKMTFEGTVPVKNNKIKEATKGILASSIWGLLFIGGMVVMPAILMVIGVFMNWEFVIEGIYAMDKFYKSIGTVSFAELTDLLVNKAAVFIHTSMCLGYIPVIAAMLIRNKENGGFVKMSMKEVPNVFKWLTISMAASFALDLLLQLACTIPYFAQEAATLSSVGVLSTAGLPWLALLTTGILAPIVEEIAFRRGIQKNMSEKFNPTVGIIVSALVFGVMHGNLFQGVFAALMGIILGVVYHKTNNLWYTTIIHIVNNSASVLITLLGLNGLVVGAAIPVVCGVAYLITKKSHEPEAVATSVMEAMIA